MVKLEEYFVLFNFILLYFYKIILSCIYSNKFFWKKTIKLNLFTLSKFLSNKIFFKKKNWIIFNKFRMKIFYSKKFRKKKHWRKKKLFFSSHDFKNSNLKRGFRWKFLDRSDFLPFTTVSKETEEKITKVSSRKKPARYIRKFYIIKSGMRKGQKKYIWKPGKYFLTHLKYAPQLLSTDEIIRYRMRNMEFDTIWEFREARARMRAEIEKDEGYFYTRPKINFNGRNNWILRKFGKRKRKLYNFMKTQINVLYSILKIIKAKKRIYNFIPLHVKNFLLLNIRFGFKNLKIPKENNVLKFIKNFYKNYKYSKKNWNFISFQNTILPSHFLAKKKAFKQFYKKKRIFIYNLPRRREKYLFRRPGISYKKRLYLKRSIFKFLNRRRFYYTNKTRNLYVRKQKHLQLNKKKFKRYARKPYKWGYRPKSRKLIRHHFSNKTRVWTKGQIKVTKVLYKMRTPLSKIKKHKRLNPVTLSSFKYFKKISYAGLIRDLRREKGVIFPILKTYKGWSKFANQSPSYRRLYPSKIHKVYSKFYVSNFFIKKNFFKKYKVKKIKNFFLPKSRKSYKFYKFYKSSELYDTFSKLIKSRKLSTHNKYIKIFKKKSKYYKKEFKFFSRRFKYFNFIKKLRKPVKYNKFYFVKTSNKKRWLNPLRSNFFYYYNFLLDKKIKKSKIKKNIDYKLTNFFFENFIRVTDFNGNRLIYNKYMKRRSFLYKISKFNYVFELLDAWMQISNVNKRMLKKAKTHHFKLISPVKQIRLALQARVKIKTNYKLTRFLWKQEKLWDSFYKDDCFVKSYFESAFPLTLSKLSSQYKKKEETSTILDWANENFSNIASRKFLLYDLENHPGFFLDLDNSVWKSYINKVSESAAIGFEILRRMAQKKKAMKLIKKLYKRIKPRDTVHSISLPDFFNFRKTDFSKRLKEKHRDVSLYYRAKKSIFSWKSRTIYKLKQYLHADAEKFFNVLTGDKKSLLKFNNNFSDHEHYADLISRQLEFPDIFSIDTPLKVSKKKDIIKYFLLYEAFKFNKKWFFWKSYINSPRSSRNKKRARLDCAMADSINVEQRSWLFKYAKIHDIFKKVFVATNFFFWDKFDRIYRNMRSKNMKKFLNYKNKSLYFFNKKNKFFWLLPKIQFIKNVSSSVKKKFNLKKNYFKPAFDPFIYYSFNKYVDNVRDWNRYKSFSVKLIKIKNKKYHANFRSLVERLFEEKKSSYLQFKFLYALLLKKNKNYNFKKAFNRLLKKNKNYDLKKIKNHFLSFNNLFSLEHQGLKKKFIFRNKVKYSPLWYRFSKKWRIYIKRKNKLFKRKPKLLKKKDKFFKKKHKFFNIKRQLYRKKINYLKKKAQFSIRNNLNKLTWQQRKVFWRKLKLKKRKSIAKKRRIREYRILNLKTNYRALKGYIPLVKLKFKIKKFGFKYKSKFHLKYKFSKKSHIYKMSKKLFNKFQGSIYNRVLKNYWKKYKILPQPKRALNFRNFLLLPYTLFIKNVALNSSKRAFNKAFKPNNPYIYKKNFVNHYKRKNYFIFSKFLLKKNYNFSYNFKKNIFVNKTEKLKSYLNYKNHLFFKILKNKKDTKFRRNYKVFNDEHYNNKENLFEGEEDMSLQVLPNRKFNKKGFVFDFDTKTYRFQEKIMLATLSKRFWWDETPPYFMDTYKKIFHDHYFLKILKKSARKNKVILLKKLVNKTSLFANKSILLKKQFEKFVKNYSFSKKIFHLNVNAEMLYDSTLFKKYWRSYIYQIYFNLQQSLYFFNKTTVAKIFTWILKNKYMLLKQYKKKYRKQWLELEKSPEECYNRVIIKRTKLTYFIGAFDMKNRMVAHYNFTRLKIVLNKKTKLNFYKIWHRMMTRFFKQMIRNRRLRIAQVFYYKQRHRWSKIRSNWISMFFRQHIQAFKCSMDKPHFKRFKISFSKKTTKNKKKRR